MAESRGMSILRSSDTSILIRAQLIDAANAKITSGTTTLRVWRVIPTTGALETYDFNDDTFKTGAVTTPTTTMTHRQAENSTYDTGVWTTRLTVLTDYDVGDKYIFEVSHGALPHPLAVEYQYGDLDGDEALHLVIRERETAQAGASNTITLNTNASSADDYYREAIVVLISGTGAGQARYISDYVGSTRIANVSPDWITNPASGTHYIIIPAAAASVESVADATWDEDIVNAHGTSATAGLLLRVLGSAISLRSFNATLNALLGVPDTAGTDTVPGQVWQETFAAHNTAGTMGKIMNDINSGGSPTAAAIADAVWDEVLTAGHAVVNSAAVMLAALNLTGRTNNATLNALLAVPDVAGATIAETLWDEDITAHTTASSAGKALDKLGSALAARTNNNTLNALLGVPDTASLTIADPIWDEILDAGHVVADSAAQRLKAIDDLTQVGGAGDLADTNLQIQKIDQAAVDDPAAAGSLAEIIQSAVDLIETLDRDVMVSVNLESTQLHIEVAVEQFGVIQTSPWIDAAAQIYDEANGLIHNIGISDFGAMGPRGLFQFDVNNHALVAGNTYQIAVQVTDGGILSISTTKPFKIIQG